MYFSWCRWRWKSISWSRRACLWTDYLVLVIRRVHEAEITFCPSSRDFHCKVNCRNFTRNIHKLVGELGFRDGEDGREERLMENDHSLSHFLFK